MNVKKSICVATASAVLMGSVAGCALFGKDKTAVTDVTVGYIEMIMSAKYNKSAKFVADEEDFFATAEIDDNTAGILSAVWGVSSYETATVEVDKNSATAEVDFTFPDLETIAEEGYSYDEYVAAIADIEETVDGSFEFELSKDGEDWYIEPDSTEDFYNFVFESLGEFAYGGLNEAGAIEVVDEFIADLASGDVDAALALSAEADGTMSDYFDELASESGATIDPDTFSGIFSSYFSRLEYTSEVTNVTDEAITVAVTGTAPDANTAISDIANNEELMVPIYADFLEGMLHNTDADYSTLYNGLFGAMAQAFSSAPLSDYACTIEVTADEDGNLYVDPDDNFVNWDIDDIDTNDDLLYQAIDLLYEQGRITADEYSLFAGSSVAPGNEIDLTCIPVEEGDDLYSYSYTATEDTIYLTVVTWAYYDEGTEFNYTVTVNGTEDAMTGEYAMPNDSEDHIELQIPLVDPTGDYIVTVYDADSTSSVLCTYEFVILSEGAPVGGFPFGTSMDYTEISDDFYTFHFLDGNGDFLDGEDTYPGNRGAVDFAARTWAYYSGGETMICQVFLDGELMDTMEVESEANATDTFVFSYEPAGGLEDGDYVFVMYDVDSSNDIFAIAYATVES